MINAGEKSAYGDQENPVSHSRVSTAEVGSSIFRPKFGVFTLNSIMVK